MKENIILIGGGGHCKSVIDVIEDGGEFQIAGILDIEKRLDAKILGFPIIGSDEIIDSLLEKYSVFHITIGHIISNPARIKLFNYLKSKKVQLPAIVAKDAYISKYASIGEGCFVGHKAFINAGAVVGENTIINTGAIIEHDSIIGAHSHISTMCAVNADCKVGDHCFLSSHTVINRGTEIANNTMVYSGAVVTKSYFQTGISLSGIPAKIHI